MFRVCTTISRIIFFVFLSNNVYPYSSNSSSDTLKRADKFNQELIDSLEVSYTGLSASNRIERIISDSRKLGYFHPDEIIFLIDKTLEEVRKTNNSKAEINLTFQKIYIVSDAYSDLERSKKLAYYILENLPATIEDQTQLLDFIARTHLSKSELIEAQNLYQEALKRLKGIKKAYSKAHTNVFWGVAVTYSESRNYQKSSEYYLKCLHQAQNQEQYFMVSSCFQNLADNARKMKQWKTSRAYLKSAKNTIKKIPNKSDRVISEMGLSNAYGDFYKSIRKPDSAIIHLKKAIQLADQYDDFYTNSYARQSLGSVYLELNRLDEAEELLLKSNKQFNEKTPSLLMDNSRYLYELYKKKGMFDESLRWHETFTSLRDSMQKVENVKTIAQATTKYEVELKDKTIDLLKKEKIVEMQSKEEYKRRWQIIIVLLLLLLVIGAFYINHNRHQKNKKKIINQVLGEERERARISMDLHDGVCSQITTISRVVKNGDQIQDEKWRKTVAEKLDNLNLEVRDISHNLSLLKYDTKIPFQHIIEDYIGDLQETVSIDFTIEFKPQDNHFFLESNRELVLFRVIQEICNNAIKYSQTKTMSLTFVRKGQDLTITIADHGIGFEESDSGNGIRNIFERIEFLNGKVQLNTKSNGTTFNISLPLNKTELK